MPAGSRPPGEDEVPDDRDVWHASLVVAYVDVDAPGGGAHAVVATAPVPQKGEPRGILLRLPHAERWRTSSDWISPLPLD
jgi:hypothetical protein